MGKLGKWLIVCACGIYLIFYSIQSGYDSSENWRKPRTTTRTESEKRFTRDMRILLDEIDWRLSLSKSSR